MLTAVLILAAVAACVRSELSDEMKEMAKMLHDNCVDESGVDEGLIEPCLKGDFAEDPKLKCYFKCIFNQMGALSDEGELDAEAFQSVLPEDMQGPLTKMILACKDVKGADACEVAFNFNKCLQKEDPANFIVI